MTAAKLTVIIFLLQCIGLLAFTSLPYRRIVIAGPYDDARRGLFASLPPIGPFCPFRSSVKIEHDLRMENFTMLTPDLTSEIASVTLDFSTGRSTPDRERLIKIADDINAEVDAWEELEERQRASIDFQTREHAAFKGAHLAARGESSVDGWVESIRWYAACVAAMATNAPRPDPPSSVDEESLSPSKLLRKVPRGADQERYSIPLMGVHLQDMLKSWIVWQELIKLLIDHKNLIEAGAKYGNFYPPEKISYLNEIEKIEERWDTQYKRLGLMGVLNEEFSRECDQFLSELDLDEQDFRSLLKESHQIMRDDAEAEQR